MRTASTKLIPAAALMIRTAAYVEGGYDDAYGPEPYVAAGYPDGYAPSAYVAPGYGYGYGPGAYVAPRYGYGPGSYVSPRYGYGPRPYMAPGYGYGPRPYVAPRYGDRYGPAPLLAPRYSHGYGPAVPNRSSYSGPARPTQLRCRHDHAPLRPIVGVVDPISLGRCGFMNKWHRPPLTSDPTRPRPRHPRPGSSFSSDLIPPP
jgi:hypothetical protein